LRKALACRNTPCHARFLLQQTRLFLILYQDLRASDEMGLSDERLLQLAGLSAGLHNAWLLANPRSFHNFHLTQVGPCGPMRRSQLIATAAAATAGTTWRRPLPTVPGDDLPCTSAGTGLQPNLPALCWPGGHHRHGADGDSWRFQAKQGEGQPGPHYRVLCLHGCHGATKCCCLLRGIAP